MIIVSLNSTNTRRRGEEGWRRQGTGEDRLVRKGEEEEKEWKERDKR